MHDYGNRCFCSDILLTVGSDGKIQVSIKDGTCLSAVLLYYYQYYCLNLTLRVWELAEKLEVLDHAFTVTSMSASIGQ